MPINWCMNSENVVYVRNRIFSFQEKWIYNILKKVTWITLEIIILGEVIQRHKDKCEMFSVILWEVVLNL